MSELGLPKNLREAVPYIGWGVLVLGFGLEFCAAFVHEEWLRATISFTLMCGLAAMALYSKDVKIWLAATNPNYVAPAVMLLLLTLILSPFVEQRRWPFTDHNTPAPAAIPTYIRFIFGNAQSAPQMLEAKNVKWQSSNYETSYYATTSSVVMESACPDGTKPIVGQCRFTSTKLLLLLSFDTPITFNKIKIDAHGGNIPKWENRLMTQSYAVIWFDDYPIGMVLDIEAID
jgi:hypothetical protein